MPQRGRPPAHRLAGRDGNDGRDHLVAGSRLARRVDHDAGTRAALRAACRARLSPSEIACAACLAAAGSESADLERLRRSHGGQPVSEDRDGDPLPRVAHPHLPGARSASAALRAAVRRRLKTAGAVYLANSVAALPASPAAERLLRRVRAQITRVGGSAQLLLAQAVAGRPT
jgi:hypothetical protein